MFGQRRVSLSVVITKNDYERPSEPSQSPGPHCLTSGLAQPGVRVFPHLLTCERPEATHGGQVGWGLERSDPGSLSWSPLAFAGAAQETGGSTSRLQEKTPGRTWGGRQWGGCLKAILHNCLQEAVVEQFICGYCGTFYGHPAIACVEVLSEQTSSLSNLGSAAGYLKQPSQNL